MNSQNIEFIIEGISFIKKPKSNSNNLDLFIEEQYSNLWKDILKTIRKTHKLKNHHFV